MRTPRRATAHHDVKKGYLLRGYGGTCVIRWAFDGYKMAWYLPKQYYGILLDFQEALSAYINRRQHDLHRQLVAVRQR